MQHNPAMLRYFDPRPASATVITTGQYQLRLQTHYSSIFLADQLPTARHYLADMELFITEARVNYGLGFHSDIAITLPLLRPMAGTMDNFLHQYHRTLGLPNSGRELRPNNQFAFFAQHNGKGWHSQPRWEIGNLQLTLRHQIIPKQWALLIGIQLPTANQHRGWSHGGRPDTALGTVGSWQHGIWFGHGEGWWIHPLIRHDIGYPIHDYFRASATLGRRIHLFASTYNLLLQTQGGSSPYRTNIAALDRSPWLISLGIRTSASNHWQWNFAFTENITQPSTQDFSLSSGITIPFSNP